MALTVDILMRLKATQTGSQDFGGPTFTPEVKKQQQLADGTAANQADIWWSDERTVGDGADDDIDLAGVLTDAFGSTITAAEGVCLFVINAPISGTANTTDLTIGIGSNPWLGFLGGTTPTVGPIKPGGFFCIGAGDAAGIGTITAGTGDILRVGNSAGAAATYQIALVARSA